MLLPARVAEPITRAVGALPPVAGLLAALICVGFAAPVAAQSVEEARRAAEEARATAESARQAAQQAEQDAAAAEKLAEERETAAATISTEEAKDLRERVEQAEENAADAWQAAAAAQEAVEELERRLAYDRSGAYFGSSVYWAPAAFSLRGGSADHSAGIAGFLGYRFHPHVATDLRVDYMRPFDLRVEGFEGEFESIAITGNIKLYLLKERIQPYITTGFGALVGDARWLRLSDGDRTKDRLAASLFRFGAGLDLYVSPSIALNLEATYNTAGGELSAVSYGQLGGGVTLRF